MKRVSVVLTIIIVNTLSSCGPSEQEVKMREKALTDSIVKAIEQNAALEKIRLDSIAQAAEMEQARKDSVEYATSEEGIKNALFQKEKKNYKKYLSVDWDSQYKLIGNDYQIRGKVYNSATVAFYKDVKLYLHLYANSGTLLKTYEMTLYEYVAPGKSKPFQYRMNYSSSFKKLQIEVMGAKAEY